jgi:hypothetical protein
MKDQIRLNDDDIFGYVSNNLSFSAQVFPRYKHWGRTISRSKNCTNVENKNYITTAINAEIAVMIIIS